LHDTEVMSRVLVGGTADHKRLAYSHKLEDVVPRYLGREIDKTEQQSDWSADELTPSQLAYAATDASVLLELAAKMLPMIECEGLTAIYNLERRVRPAVAAMEGAGVAIDKQALEERIAKVTDEASHLRSELEEVWGINPNSSKQLMEKFNLRERKNWPKTANGNPKTDEDAMKALRVEDPLIETWLAWKDAEKQRSTYGESLLKHVGPDGRVRGRFDPFGAMTGRFSCSSPNMQNFPPEVRSLFWSGSEDRVLIKADYYAIEVLIAATLFRDERMKEALAAGDVHRATAAGLFNLDSNTISKESRERAIGKAANFQLLYGMGPETFGQRVRDEGVHMTSAEAKEYHRKFFETYKGIAAKHKQARRNFKPRGYNASRTALGRRRDSADWFSKLLNHEVQGTGADGLKVALAKLHESRDRFPTAKIVAVVHDDITVECDAAEAEAVKTWVEECMQEGMLEALGNFRSEVPMTPKVDAKIQRNW
jgi:DNA polymerase-1